MLGVARIHAQLHSVVSNELDITFTPFLHHQFVPCRHRVIIIMAVFRYVTFMAVLMVQEIHHGLVMGDDEDLFPAAAAAEDQSRGGIYYAFQVTSMEPRRNLNKSV